LGCWISPCYGPFSLGQCFESYKPLISLIFQFFGGRSEARVTETTDPESVDTGARLYLERKNMNDIWWDVLTVHAGCVHSSAGCGIVFMPLGTILFSQLKLPVNGITNMVTI
jgi:hypothetical protein